MELSDSLRISGGRPDLLAPVANGPRAPVSSASPGGSFAAILEREVETREGVRFSSHALQRMADRNVVLTTEDKARLGRSLDLAASKGGRQTLVLLDTIAVIANVPNRTVITVTKQDELNDLVFTNIDSTVVATSDTRDQRNSSRTLL
jgi:flagellar operon protein